MIFVLITVLILTIVIFLFSSPKLSPIPYFPTQKVDIPLIIETFRLKNNQTIIDLGAGDGIVIFKAAKQAFDKKLDTRFIAVDINPILILIMFIRRFFHPNKKNIRIVYNDIFKMNLKRFTLHATRYTFYLYISPWHLEKIILNIKTQISIFTIVSYMYPIKTLKNKQKIIRGKNSIFSYDF